MAWQDALGGAAGGALAGAPSGPLGMAAGAILGGISGLFGGGGGPAPYEPTVLEKSLQNYALGQLNFDPFEKKAAKSRFQNLIASGNRGAAENFYETLAAYSSKPDMFNKALAKSYKKPIDYSSKPYMGIVDDLYRTQGISPDEDFKYWRRKLNSFEDKAKAFGIRSPQAFADMVKQDMLASGQVPSAQQEMLSYMFGDPVRHRKTGRILNLYEPYIPLADRRASGQLDAQIKGRAFRPDSSAASEITNQILA